MHARLNLPRPGFVRHVSGRYRGHLNGDSGRIGFVRSVLKWILPPFWQDWLCLLRLQPRLLRQSGRVGFVCSNLRGGPICHPGRIGFVCGFDPERLESYQGWVDPRCTMTESVLTCKHTSDPRPLPRSLATTLGVTKYARMSILRTWSRGGVAVPSWTAISGTITPSFPTTELPKRPSLLDATGGQIIRGSRPNSEWTGSSLDGTRDSHTTTTASGQLGGTLGSLGVNGISGRVMSPTRVVGWTLTGRPNPDTDLRRLARRSLGDSAGDPGHPGRSPARTGCSRSRTGGTAGSGPTRVSLANGPAEKGSDANPFTRPRTPFHCRRTSGPACKTAETVPVRPVNDRGGSSGRYRCRSSRSRPGLLAFGGAEASGPTTDRRGG